MQLRAAMISASRLPTPKTYHVGGTFVLHICLRQVYN
jgi:hypothetical protein